jgi:hypothetical protein
MNTTIYPIAEFYMVRTREWFYLVRIDNEFESEAMTNYAFSRS